MSHIFTAFFIYIFLLSIHTYSIIKLNKFIYITTKNYF